MVSLRIERRGDAAKRIGMILEGMQGPRRVKAGFPSGQAGGDIVMRAVWQEFGTTRIPERPFIRNAMTANLSGYRDLARSSAEQIIAGSMTMRRALERMGIKAQGDIQKEMPGTPPPNAPSTIRQKGSSMTLVDSGQLRQSVSWVIDE